MSLLRTREDAAPFTDLTSLTHRINPSLKEPTHAPTEKPAGLQAGTLPQESHQVLIFDRLRQAISLANRSDLLVAVILMDLDNFKAINNRFGQAFGDRLLNQIAQRIEHSLRAGDTVTRIGPGHDCHQLEDAVVRFSCDEFVIIATGLPNMEVLEFLCNRILHLTALPYEIDDWKVSVTACLGITVYPFDSGDMETLIRHADQAMSVAKELGGNHYQLYDARRNHDPPPSEQLQERLKLALSNDELLLHYQPTVNMRTGRVQGVEALLRWNHPERGLILPNEFLPKLEDDELIRAIGEWVIRKALTQAAEWRRIGLKFGISVNLSARHLLHGSFIGFLRRCLADFPDLPPGTLGLEILESSAIDEIIHVSRTIKTCTRLGVNFSLDDFGTGYASLTYLKEIPAQTLKIDHLLIRDILDNGDHLTLVKGIVVLATAFHRATQAEGVETAEQGVLLMQLGCDLAQGYGIARPMPAERIPAWVSDFRPEPLWSLWADTNWDMIDFPLLVAEYDHLKWVSQIVRHVEGDSLDISLSELTDHHQCRFGHWYYGHGTLRYGHLDAFRDIEDTHQDVHGLGQEILQALHDGDAERARELVHELLVLKDLILEKLGGLQLAIANKH
jgi:EAL domain-containing protein (putative c-di-GMP-specific phosphodiesterase class I)/GGDEF domain-containing protein